jgi:rhodanese-related sulfurtransferase
MPVDTATLKAWLSDGCEIALLDVREHGQYGMGHLFFAVPLPYSRFELGLPALVPNRSVRLVLCDGGNGIAARAAALGYTDVFVLEGGVPAWDAAGYKIYAGVNVPSKVFGEIVEHQRHTPRISARDLEAMRERGDNFVIVDGRPWTEYRRMSIPGGICCPNGELVLRIRDIAPDPGTRIVVNCAGRTRSIIGARTLIDFGVPNPVFALENGTQGWFLAGLELARNADRRYGDARPESAEQRSRAQRFAIACGAPSVTACAAHAWLGDATRTTYFFDVRTAEEFATDGLAGFVHAPGGQLVQATDQWVGVRGARIVLYDREAVRAPVIAGWLRQLGHEAHWLADATAAASLDWRRAAPAIVQRVPPSISVDEAAAALRAGTPSVLDLRPGMTYRKGHIAGAVWAIRPKIGAARLVAGTIILVADEPAVAALAGLDLAEAGSKDIRLLGGGYDTWREAGLPVEASPDRPTDADCIDFLFFTHDRHDGNAEAARQYLAWETGTIKSAACFASLHQRLRLDVGSLDVIEVPALDADELHRRLALGRMDRADVVELHVAGMHLIRLHRLDQRRLPAFALLDDLPLSHLGDTGRLAVDRPARAVVVR